MKPTFVVCSTKNTLGEGLSNAVYSNEGIQSDSYHLVAGDLRDMAKLGKKLLSTGLDTRCVCVCVCVF